jgi:hypothetical protein
MIVLKLERLRARERSISRQALEEEVASIAAEQRAVRANFVFLMGGQVEDEEEEAEHSHEIQEGRLENTARREIVIAINHMGRVESGLAAVNTGEALPPAKAAVEALQRAFGRNRYFLRTLPVRSRIDPSRRLTGETRSASDWRRDVSPAERDAIVVAATTLRSRLVEMGTRVSDARFDAGVLTSLAETALATAPGEPDWQAIAQGLLKLRDAAPAARLALLADAVTRVTAIAEGGSLAVEPAGRDRRERSMRSAWAEEQRR